MAKRSVTRNEVAKFAGVSSATVSYVINDGPRPVSEATRKKVEEAIEILGYRPNALARNLRRQKTNSLGLIIPDNLNPFFAEVARGVERVAFEHGYIVILCHSAYHLEREMDYIEMLISQQAAGVIWVPGSADAKPARKLMHFQVPFVFLAHTLPDVHSPSIMADNLEGAYQATKHLLTLGHRRIGYITRSVELSHSLDRMQGYKTALREFNVPFNPAYVVKGGFKIHEGSSAAERLISIDSSITAIVCYNDMMAIGAMQALKNIGMRIPEDISIVGMDDIPTSSYTCPPLTTAHMPTVEMGARGAKMLIDLLGADKGMDVDNVCLDVGFIVRESTAPPRTY